MAIENTPPLRLPREQLASFLKDQRQIKAFENLFAIVESIAPDLVQQALLQAGTAQASATQALAKIDQAIQEAAIASATADAKSTQALNALQNIVQDAALLCGAADNKAAQALQAIEQLKTIIETVATGPAPTPAKRTCYGAFFDTTTQTAAAINTAYAMTFNTTDLSFGVRRGATTSQIFIDQEGVYDIQFSAQLDNTSGGNHLAFIWLRVNGVNVANSASQVRLKSTDGELVAAWNFFYSFKAGDYFELMWSVSDTAVQFTAQAAVAPVPAIPSVILTVSNNIKT